jgi:hypothetical protein
MDGAGRDAEGCGRGLVGLNLVAVTDIVILIHVEIVLGYHVTWSINMSSSQIVRGMEHPTSMCRARYHGGSCLMTWALQIPLSEYASMISTH